MNNEYRVLMCDDYDGSVFTFAIRVVAACQLFAQSFAEQEFPKADVIKIVLTKFSVTSE